MDPALKKFVDKVFAINPTQANIFAGGSGVAGAGNNSFGTTGIELLNSLRNNTVRFAKASASKASAEEVQKHADEVEGNILNLQALGEMPDRIANPLIDALHDLTRTDGAG